jgi:hypothetical protein
VTVHYWSSVIWWIAVYKHISQLVTTNNNALLDHDGMWWSTKSCITASITSICISQYPIKYTLGQHHYMPITSVVLVEQSLAELNTSNYLKWIRKHS